MGWHYRAPSKFPAIFLATLREAALRSPVPVPLGDYVTDKEAQVVAEKFRWFRWCIRKEEGADRELTNILLNFEVRTSVDEDEVGFILSVIAKPTKVSEFIRLNPSLAESVLSECQ